MAEASVPYTLYLRSELELQVQNNQAEIEGLLNEAREIKAELASRPQVNNQV